MALARAGSGLLAQRRRERERELGLQPQESLAVGMRRMALAQADLALEQLDAAAGEDPVQAVHEARKAIKRMRTIVRMMAGELGARERAREQDALRAAAAGLAAARDAEVLLNTLDALVARNSRELAARKGVARLRGHLVGERDRAERLAQAPANRLAVARELRAFRSRAAAWRISERPGLGPVEVGLRRLYQQGRLRGRRAARARRGRMLAMHEWRKRVKDLRYAAEALERAQPSGPLTREPRRTGRARREAEWLHRLAVRADKLGELLGEEHDLAVLEEWLRGPDVPSRVGKRTRRRLLRLISKRRAKLRRRALSQRGDLYGRTPSAFMRRLGRSYESCAPKLS